MKKIDKIIEEMFYETEKSDALKYYESSELNQMMHEKLLDDDFMNFEERLNEFACELAKYWYMQGFHIRFSYLIAYRSYFSVICLFFQNRTFGCFHPLKHCINKHHFVSWNYSFSKIFSNSSIFLIHSIGVSPCTVLRTFRASGNVTIFLYSIVSSLVCDIVPIPRGSFGIVIVFFFMLIPHFIFFSYSIWNFFRNTNTKENLYFARHLQDTLDGI